MFNRLDKERFDKLWGEQHKGSLADAVKKQEAAKESSASGEGAPEGMAMKVRPEGNKNYLLIKVYLCLKIFH